jgi:hypothetical protein
LNKELQFHCHVTKINIETQCSMTQIIEFSECSQNKAKTDAHSDLDLQQPNQDCPLEVLLARIQEFEFARCPSNRHVFFPPLPETTTRCFHHHTDSPLQTSCARELQLYLKNIQITTISNLHCQTSSLRPQQSFTLDLTTLTLPLVLRSRTRNGARHETSSPRQPLSKQASLAHEDASWTRRREVQGVRQRCRLPQADASVEAERAEVCSFIQFTSGRGL